MNFGKIKQLARSIIETDYHLDKEIKKKKKKELMQYMHQLSLNIDSELE